MTGITLHSSTSEIEKQQSLTWAPKHPGRRYDVAKRLIDLALALMAGVFVLLPMALIALAIKVTSKGPALHWSKRVGRNNELFFMPKFRSMRMNTPQLATHLLNNPGDYLTPIGRVLRKTSLDELPQLYSILIGDISFVGPRPALFNQNDLVALRTEFGIHQLIPGLTGWAQINGRDELTIPEKVQFEREYLARRSLWCDFKIIVETFRQAFFGKGVSH